MSQANGRAKTVQTVDDQGNPEPSFSTEMYTGQLAQAYGLTERQMNKIILAVETKGYPMQPRIGDRNRRYWSGEQQFWIKMQHSGCLEPRQRQPEAQPKFEPDTAPDELGDRPEQSAQEYALMQGESGFLETRMTHSRNKGANLAIAEGKATINGYVQVKPTVDRIVGEALEQLSSSAIEVPVPQIAPSELADLETAVRRCLL
jgi:plasmid maintenance system antidote protein VapI